jgi:hypothetical protein
MIVRHSPRWNPCCASEIPRDRSDDLRPQGGRLDDRPRRGRPSCDPRSRLAAQLGDAVGTLASLGADGPAVATAFAAELGLAEPVLPWHTDRVRIAELASALATAAGSITKTASRPCPRSGTRGRGRGLRVGVSRTRSCGDGLRIDGGGARACRGPSRSCQTPSGPSWRASLGRGSRDHRDASRP